MKKRTIIGLSLFGAIILVVGIVYGLTGPQIKAARSVEQIAAVASKDLTRWTMVYNREKRRGYVLSIRRLYPPNHVIFRTFAPVSAAIGRTLKQAVAEHLANNYAFLLKNDIFLHFSSKIFGSMKNKLYLCTLFGMKRIQKCVNYATENIYINPLFGSSPADFRVRGSHHRTRCYGGE